MTEPTELKQAATSILGRYEPTTTEYQVARALLSRLNEAPEVPEDNPYWEAIAELTNIAKANPKNFQDDTEFRLWAQNRAYFLIENIAAPSPTPNLQQAVDAAYDSAAEIAERIAKLMDQGAGEIEPGDRLRQVARMIRDRKGQPTLHKTDSVNSALHNSVTAGVEKELRKRAKELSTYGQYELLWNSDVLEMLADQIGEAVERGRAALQSSGEGK